MNRRFFALTTAAVALLSPAVCHAEDPPPTADEVLRLVRLSYALQDYSLTGQLRDDDTGATQAFQLTMSQQVIRFRFSNPNEIINLDLATSPPTLSRVIPGGKQEVPLSMLGAPVRGMAVSYEDLALRFLDWPNGQMLGDEKVSTVKCWKVRVTTPDGAGAYGTVDVWVHQESGGMAQMEAYDRSGKKIKRFQVRKIQKAGDATVLKEMRIETFDPASGKTVARTYMSMDKPEKN